MARVRNDETPASRAIRAAGYVRVPGGLWVTPEERDLIMFMAEKHLPRITWIKNNTDPDQ